MIARVSDVCLAEAEECLLREGDAKSKSCIDCAHRASILRSKIDARLGGRLALIGRDAIEKKYF